APGLPFSTSPVSDLRRSAVLRWVVAPVTVVTAVLSAICQILRYRPRVVLGMFGFVIGPGGFAAWLCRRPLVIHEQNAVPGLTNRLLSRFARVVLEAFPGSFPPACGAVDTGHPVRRELAELAAPAQRLGARTGARVLVFGG